MPCVPAQAADKAWCSVSDPQAAGTMPALLRHLASVRNRPPAPLPRVHTEGTLPHHGI
ncbi:hypothetical protein APS_2745 [Acetobacter pasteurianus subsp. pasteurianus LMG 1262 = NBRC 106471]|nr:hypothetical protein APS_2745 [Acetobacter pasteurianus subsp. pasteurianus LMG 1262 = NBRC 106471]